MDYLRTRTAVNLGYKDVLQFTVTSKVFEELYVGNRNDTTIIYAPNPAEIPKRTRIAGSTTFVILGKRYNSLTYKLAEKILKSSPKHFDGKKLFYTVLVTYADGAVVPYTSVMSYNVVDDKVENSDVALLKVSQ